MPTRTSRRPATLTPHPGRADCRFYIGYPCRRQFLKWASPILERTFNRLRVGILYGLSNPVLGSAVLIPFHIAFAAQQVAMTLL